MISGTKGSLFNMNIIKVRMEEISHMGELLPPPSI